MADQYLDLVKGQTVKLDAGGLDCISVRSGEIWLTQERDSRDYILRAGSVMTPSRPGPVFIQAREQARLSLHLTVRKASAAEVRPILKAFLAWVVPQKRRGFAGGKA